MGNTDADYNRHSNDISPADADTQPDSSMTTSGADVSRFEESEKRSETETRPELQTQNNRLPPDKAMPRYPLPLIIPRASANTTENSSSPSHVSFPMSPSLPSSHPPAAPTPTPISATPPAPHPLLHSLPATTDSAGCDGSQPNATSDTTAELISPNPQLNSPSSQLESSASREGNGNLTKRISGGKSKQSDVKVTHDDVATSSVLLPPSSKTPLINAKSRPSSLPQKQSPSGYDSSLLSLLFCCTRTGPSPRSTQQPQPLPITNATPTSDSQSPTSNSTAGRVFNHGHNGSALGSLARFLPTMPRKGKENGKETKSKQEGKEQVRVLRKPCNSRKVSANDVGTLQNANAARNESHGTGRLDTSPLIASSSRDPTANIITSVSSGKPPSTVVRRRSSVFGHHGRPGKTMLRPLDAEDTGKKCLVLDLDETLVHSSFKMITQADFVVPVEIDSTVHNVYVLKRPGVDTFLKKMGELFEVVVFTASLAKYADPVLDMLDKHKVVKHRLFRESCFNHKGNYVKDLSQLGRDIRSVIIIDNSPTSYIFHPTNAVPITSWFNDPLDTELLDLMPFLEDLTMVENVTVVLDQGG